MATATVQDNTNTNPRAKVNPAGVLPSLAPGDSFTPGMYPDLRITWTETDERTGNIPRYIYRVENPETGETWSGPLDFSPGKIQEALKKPTWQDKQKSRKDIRQKLEQIPRDMLGVVNAPGGETEKGIYKQILLPGVMGLPAVALGLPGDLLSILSLIPMHDKEMQKSFQDFAQSIGTEGMREKYENLTRKVLGKADDWLIENTGMQGRLFEESIGYKRTMTPDQESAWQRWLAMAMDVGPGGAAQTKATLGALAAVGKHVGKHGIPGFRKIGRFAEKAEKTISAPAEVAFGVTGAAAAQLAGEMLPDDAPPALRLAVETAAFFGAPITAKNIAGVVGQLPGANKYLVRLGEPIFNPKLFGGRYILETTYGKGTDARSQLLTADKVLEYAIAQNKLEDVLPLTYTTPELLKTRANAIRSEMEFKQQQLSQGKTSDTLNKKDIRNLHRQIKALQNEEVAARKLAGFYEEVLNSAFATTGGGAAHRKFRQNHLERLIKRRRQYYDLVERRFSEGLEKIDFGGAKGNFTPEQLAADYAQAKAGGAPVYEETMRRLVSEGDPQGIAQAELTFLKPDTKKNIESLQKSIDDELMKFFEEGVAGAQEELNLWRRSVNDLLRQRGLKSVDELPVDEQKMVADVARGIFDTQLANWKAQEKAYYRAIGGYHKKNTRKIVFPEGSVDSRGNPLPTNTTPAEYAARELEILSRSESFNPQDIPVELVQLLGGRASLATIKKIQKAKGVDKSAEVSAEALDKRRTMLLADMERLEGKIEAQAATDRVFGRYNPADPTTKARKLEAQRESLQGRINKTQGDMDRLSASYVETAGRLDEQGKPVEALRLKEHGRLDVIDADGNLIGDGVSLEDLDNLLSDLGKRIRTSSGKKRKHLVQLRNDLRQLESTEVFPDLDATALARARQAAKSRITIEDAQGDVLEMKIGASAIPRVPAETLTETILPVEEGTKVSRAGELSVRRLELAAMDVPSNVSFKTNPDGTLLRGEDRLPVAIINKPRFLIDALEAPFEMFYPGKYKRYGELRLKKDYPVSDSALDIGENILLERIALQFSSGVDSKALDIFRKQNEEVISWLQKNGRPQINNLTKDAETLAGKVDIYNAALKEKTIEGLERMVSRSPENFDPDAMEKHIRFLAERDALLRRRLSEEKIFADLLNADPGYAMRQLFDRVLKSENYNPKTDLEQFASLVRTSPEAERGMQAAFVGELWRRTLKTSDELETIVGSGAGSYFDPESLRTLLSDPKVRTALKTIFPDNPDLHSGLDIMAKAASEVKAGGTNVLKAAGTQNLNAWSNLGRFAGLAVADRIKFINSLVAAGAGARELRALGLDITGNVARDTILAAALTPSKARELHKVVADTPDGFGAFLKERFLVDLYQVPKWFRRGATEKPGATVQFIKEELERIDEQQEEQRGDQTSMAPSPAPNYVMLREPPRSRPYAMLSTPRATAPTAQATATQATATQAPVTPERLEQARLIDPAFFGNMYAAKNGGYIDAGAGSGMGRLERSKGIMSIKRKGRQLVG